MRAVLSSFLFLILVACPFVNLNAQAASSSISAVDLKADNRINPLGIDRFPVMLSWRMDADVEALPGVAQVAYQIVAASSRADLLAEKYSWDTGGVADSRTHQIPYAGPLPERGERIWWRVRMEDSKAGVSDWSEPAWFEAGLLDDSGWGDAEWIRTTRDYQAPEMAPPDLMGDWMGSSTSQADRFELVFDLLEKEIISAKAYGYLPENYGVRTMSANADRMNPTQIGMRQRPWKRPNGVLDFATDLMPGASNCIMVETGKPVDAASFRMRVIYADGTDQVFQSGADWQLSLGEQSLGKAQVLEPYGGSRFGEVHLYAQTGHGPAWLRRSIEVKPGLQRARLYLCALGQGLTYLNGEIVDEVYFSSPQSDYEEFAYYTTHDITHMLQTGKKNALSVLLDGSWYHQVGGFQFILSYGAPGLKAKVVLEYEDGRIETITSNADDWEWKESATTLANIYLGEIIDYRLDHDEWKRPSAGNDWQAVKRSPPLTPKTKAIDVAPVRSEAELLPVDSWQVGSETWLFDMGEVIHGVIRLDFDEPEGTVIRTRYAELAEDGKILNVPTSQWNVHGLMQRDEIIAGGRPQTFQNMFTTKSFRYVEVSGLSKKPKMGELIAVKVNTESDILTTFESSDPMLNRLYENGIRTFENYMNHMSGDMPRERCLWGLESVYSFQTAAYCFDWKNNHRLMDTLWWTGRMTPAGIPGNIGVGLRLTERTQSFLWSATPIFSMSNLLEFYEDAEPLEHYYHDAKHFIRYFEANSVDGVYPEPNRLSDHAAPLELKRGRLDQRLLNTMAFFDVQQRFARMADALGHTDDAAHARAYAEKIRAAIMKDYDTDNHTFGIGTHDSIALAYGVIEDPAEEERLARSLVETYRANGHKFDGGFMSYEIYPMLAKYGYVEDAYKMLVNDNYPGPAWSVTAHDATTYYERYWMARDEFMKVGHNFWAFAHPTGWMVADLGGIRYTAPHGRAMRFAPKVPRSGDLEFVNSTLQTPSGLYESSWTYQDEVFRWSFTVPANGSAEVHIPASDPSAISGAEGLTLIRVQADTAAYKAIPGKYSIESRLSAAEPDAAITSFQTGNANEWRVSSGSRRSIADGVMTVTRSATSSTQMLAPNLPDFADQSKSKKHR